jgi:D-alanyl-D-alanine carboxypeptidase
MTWRRSSVAAPLLAALLATACSSAGRGSPPAHSSASSSPSSSAGVRRIVPIDQPALDAIADRYRQACGSPGAAVGLRTGDQAEHFAISGSLAPGVVLDRDSQFLAGSVTKLFVAAVALQVIAAGELSLDDTVDHFLPDWPRGDQITVAMLLGHRSGMGDFGNDFSTQLRDLVLSDLHRAYRYDEVLDLVRAIPPVAEPGSTYHYSNANTIVLGAVLQHVTKQSLGELIQDRLIDPLGLTRTIYGPDDLDAADAVIFHGLFDIVGDGNAIDIGPFPRTAALTVDPAGAGLFSSLPDLLTATHALFATDDVLAAPQRDQLTGAVSTLSAADLLLDDRFVIRGHGGASPGAQTIVAYDQAHDVTVAVWCNRLDPGEHELLPSVIAAKEVFELAAPSGP